MTGKADQPGNPTGVSLKLVACLILAIMTMSLYWQTGSHQFNNYDDPMYVSENAMVQQGITPSSIAWAFSFHGYAANWHPLTWLSHMLDMEIGGMKAGVHHLTNAVLHTTNTVLLFLAILQLTGLFWPAAFTAAAFGWHPLHVESVAWVAERKDVLSTFFWILTLMTYARYVQTRPGPKASKKTAKHQRWYLLTLLFFVLGLMSKPMVVTLPCVLLLLDVWPLKRIATDSMKVASIFGKLLVEKTPFFVLVLFSCVVTWVVQQKAGATKALVLPLSDRISNAIVSYVTYLQKTIIPINLAVFYPHPGENLHGGKVLLCLLILLAFTAYVLWKFKSRSFLFTGWFWYLGTLVPVIGILQVGEQALADRYSYIPLIGIFLMLAVSARELIREKPVLKMILPAAGCLCLMSWVLLTYRQVGVWKNSETLFVHALKSTSGNYLAHNNLGNAFMTQADALQSKGDESKANEFYVKAVENYEKAIQVLPGYSDAHNNLGLVLYRFGQLEMAIHHYSLAIQNTPTLHQAHHNRGLAFGNLNKLDEALADHEEAIRLKPDYLEARSARAKTLYSLGRAQEAIVEYQAVLQMNPLHIPSMINLGVILMKVGDLNQASVLFEKVLSLDPSSHLAWFNLGLSKEKAGLFREARQYYHEALRIAPDFERARENLSRLPGT